MRVRHLNAAGILALKSLSLSLCLQQRDNTYLPGRITVHSALRSLGGWCCWWKVQTSWVSDCLAQRVLQTAQPRALWCWTPPQPTSGLCDKIHSTNWSARSAAVFHLASYWLLVLRLRGLNKEAASRSRVLILVSIALALKHLLYSLKCSVWREKYPVFPRLLEWGSEHCNRSRHADASGSFLTLLEPPSQLPVSPSRWC